MSFLLKDYFFDLPSELIATSPALSKTNARMLLFNRSTEEYKDKHVYNLPDYLPENSIVVLNNTKVIPARLPGIRSTGGKIEVLLLEEKQPKLWFCKIKNAKRLKRNETLFLCNKKVVVTFLEQDINGRSLIEFKTNENTFLLLEQYGFAPIPPYIQKTRKSEIDREIDLTSYQTCYAKEYGAIAAPTAGLHFTKKLLDKIKEKNIEVLEVTLHVGLGTFEPIRVSDIRDFAIHKEIYSIQESVANQINEGKRLGKKIIAIGTTSVRALESSSVNGKVQAGHKKTQIFIYPPYEFKVVDHLFTNFHLPESSLLMLVSAFASREKILEMYQKAVTWRYRFFSYGDAMLIL